MQLLETIRFEKGRFSNLEYHQDRMNNARRQLFNCKIDINLLSVLQKSSFPLNNQIHKCRVEYDTDVIKVELLSYKLPIINSLKLIKCNDIDYRFKYRKRDRLMELYSQKGETDDIIIIKNGLVTDSSTANLLFFNGKQWITPTTPLLKGTQRAFLLENEVIQTAIICPTDLQYFEKVRLINAMLRFEDEVDVRISEILT